MDLEISMYTFAAFAAGWNLSMLSFKALLSFVLIHLAGVFFPFKKSNQFASYDLAI